MLAGVVISSAGGALAADLPRTPVVYAPPPVAVPVTPTVSAYSYVEGIHLHNVFPGHEYKSDIVQSVSGVNFTVTPYVNLGGGLIYTHSDNDLLYLNGKSEDNGLIGFGTANFNVFDLFNFGVSGGYGVTQTEQVRPVGNLLSFADYDSDIWFVSAYVNKTFQFGDLYLTPQARVLYSETDTDAYFESTGIFNAAQESTLGQLAVGGQVAYAIRTTENVTLFPTVEAMFLYDFDLPLFQRDRTAVELRAGLNATAGNVSVGATYVTILDRDELDEYHGVRVFASYRF